MKNASTIMNLGITVKIALIPTSKTFEQITIEARIKKETEEVKAKTPIEITHNSTKIKHTK